MNARKSLALTATVAVTALGLAACSSGGSSTATSSAPATSGTSATTAATDYTATLTVWENNTTGKGPQFWTDTVAAYKQVHPNVTVTVQPVQNEDLDGKLQTALNGGDAPDVFLQRGGGKLGAMVDAGFVADISNSLSDATKAAIPASALAADSYKGKVYAMPMTVLPGGFFYSKDLFAKAGITSTPKTLADLNDAVTKLKAAGIAPVALGAKDAWPAAHWFYWFALRECSQDALNTAANSANLADPCFVKAGQDLQTFSATKPFNDGFLTTSAQQGAGSSAGLVANHKAAMELMGAWDPGVIGSLTPDQKNLPDLGFFPFPSVPGGAGDATAMMGGLDAYSCSAKAPMPACTDFLNFLASDAIQTSYSVAASAPPASSKAAAAVTDPLLQEVMSYNQKAAYVSLWLDTRLGQNIGNALNTGVVDMLAGKGDPAGIITAANNAAAKG
jgi:raffinose/stachyose/melibiose transport system substrate-binding protein